MFAAAELAPLARVGGLAEAASGLVAELRRDPDRHRVDVDVVIPDYGDVTLDSESTELLAIPDWAGGHAVVRRGVHRDVGPVTLIGTEAMARAHPYVDTDGQGWPDNDVRFFGFSAALAALVAQLQPDVVHLNDWHTAAAVGFIDPPIPTVLTIHTLGYQGVTSPDWLARIPHHRDDFRWFDVTNPLVAAIRRADRIIAVSPNYAREILTPEMGAGLDRELAARGDAVIGIRNGVDADQWNPTTNAHIARTYRTGDAARGKLANRRALLQRVGLPVEPEMADPIEPVIGLVSRLVEQKGIDLLAEVLPFLEHMGAKLVALGAGDPATADLLHRAAARWPDRIAFHDGYDADLAHLIFAGSDLFVMPSRFEPCGLAQMQAMAYGSLPVVTAVGGLVDTVIDADVDPTNGTGFVARRVSPVDLTDALHRAVRHWHAKSARARARRNAMTTDWSWSAPAAAHAEIYHQLTSPS